LDTLFVSLHQRNSTSFWPQVPIRWHAQVDDGPCVMYVGPGGAGNFVKMVHNGIEYGDMQLISEAYDVLRTVGGFNNDEIADIFVEWNKARAPGRPVSASPPLPVLCYLACRRRAAAFPLPCESWQEVATHRSERLPVTGDRRTRYFWPLLIMSTPGQPLLAAEPETPLQHRLDGFICCLQGVLDSFLIEITSMILPTKDKMGDGFLVDKILDKTGMKGTGVRSSPRLVSAHTTTDIWLCKVHCVVLRPLSPHVPP